LKTPKPASLKKQTRSNCNSPKMAGPDHDRQFILIIAAVAIGFRLFYFWQLPDSPICRHLIHDSALFSELAHAVVKNGLILAQPFYLAPLYIYFLAAIYHLFGDTVTIVRLIQFSLGVGTALLTFAIARHFF
jgi:predicted membrane-bound mannosyltransferase